MVIEPAKHWVQVHVALGYTCELEESSDLDTGSSWSNDNEGGTSSEREVQIQVYYLDEIPKL